MKKQLLILIALAILGLGGLSAQPMNGTYTIGPSGDFASITVAVSTLNTNGFSGGPVVFELMADYLSSAETFPIVFPATLPTTVDNTLTLRPAADATALSISHTAGITMQINGADYVTIDGRPGGTGATPELTISNTLVAGSATAGVALQLINGASSNTIQYCNFTGVSTSTSGAVVSIYTSTAVAGNNNNLIDHCNIYNGATKPTVLFVSAGTASKANTANIVSNNNFYNWQMASVNGVAMTIGANNTDMVVTGNSFYQTIPTASISQNSNAFVNIGGANGTSFTNNYLGGSAPLCAGSPMSLTYQTYYGVVRGINLTAGTVSPTSIQGNTIANIEIIAPSGNSASFIGINQIIGVVNIGNVTPNIIGSTTVPNSINIISNGSASFTGISVTSTSSSADQTNIAGNIISGISMNTGTGTASFTGINASSFYTQNIYVTGNTIGSATMANAISNSTPGSTVGISNTCRYNSFINNNTVANLTSLNTATSGNQLIGISSSGALSDININNNTIFNLSSSSAITGTGGSSSLIGISVAVTSGSSHSVSNNTIYGLSNVNATAAVKIAGITYSGPTTANNVVAGNFIHSLNLASSETTSSITGIYALNGNTSYHNNMVRLGIDATGTGITTGYAINGIRDEATTGAGNTNSFYHNTVYIGGTGLTGTTSNTFALNSTVVTNVTNIRNNILVNARSGGSTGKHYAIAAGGTTPAPAGLTSSHNIFFVPGTGGTLGLFNATDQLTLTDWQNATAVDGLSAQTDPMLMLPDGSSATVNLHVQASNPIEGSGVPIAAITDDFDGDVRSSNTPVDIGADAGIFTNSGDLFPPNIAFTPLLNTASTTSPELAVEITDGVAVSSGANQPRLYFKKATDANAFAGNTSADNGWKYTFATNTASTYTFLIDYSLLNGGMVLPGDVVQYFVVAQDDVDNFASLAAGATSSSTSDPVQNINGAPSMALLNSYLIINNNISGTFTVPGNYASLTGAGGLFEAINIGTVTGNFTVQITDNLVEPGTFALNQFASPYTMTIVPASASLKTITGNVNDGLIRFNGADNVTIDGRYNGSGNYLEFINTSTGTAATNCVMLFTNGATYNTVKYSTIKAQSGSGSVIYFYAIGTNTGNNSFNTIDHCNIDGSAAKPTGITSYYNTSGGMHVSNTISNNNIYDFTTNGISLAVGLSDWTISGNSFYQTAPRVQTSEINVILVSTGANHLISGNYIGGSAPMAGGSPWTITGNGAYFRGMYLYNTISNFIAENNTITNFNINTTSSANSFYGIHLSLTTNGSVTGNTIGSTTAADAIVINRGVTSTDYGIYKLGATGTVPINGNSIGGITLSSNTTALSHSFQAITYTGSATTVNNNIIGSLTVPNSIHSSTASVSTTGQSITAISASFPAGVCSVSGNTIANITNNYQGTAAAGTVRGISTLGVGNVTVNENTISNLSNAAPLTGTGNSAAVIAIADNATGAAKVISNNMVTGLSSASASATVTGIYAGAGTGSYYNNVVNLGSGITTGSAFTGIQIGAGTSPVYYNTVNITGVVEGTSLATYAFYSLPTGVRNYRNNNFVNTRSGGTSGTHYAIRVAGTTPGQANLVLDYNNYFVSGPALGFFNNLDVADLAAWKLAVGYDVNSISADPLFTSATDLHTNEAALNSGTPIAGITLDITGTLRNTVSPTMGAYETSCSNPANGGVIAAAVITGCDPFDPDMITSTSLPSGNTGTLEYMWQQSTVSAVSGFSDIANSNTETYNPGVLNVNTWFKRLARVDCKGTWAGAAESNVVMFTVNPLPVITTSNTFSICSGLSPAIALTATVPSTFTWTVGTITGGVTGASNGSGALIDQILTNSGIVPGSVQYIVTPTSVAGLCAGTPYTITVTVNPIKAVSISIIASQNPACDGTMVTYFAIPVNGGTNPVYQWKVNGINAGTNTNNYAYIPLNGDVITCQLTVGNDVICPSVTTATSNAITMGIIPYSDPTIVIATSTGTICAGSSLTFSATTTNQGNAPTYQWKVNGINAGNNSPSFNYTASNYTTQTTDVITCDLTSNSPCATTPLVTSNAINITVNPILVPGVVIAADVNNVCQGTIVTFTATPTNGGTAPVYQWYNGATAVGTNSPVFSYSPVNGDMITVVMTSNATPCLSVPTATSNQVVMTVRPLPQLAITANGVTVTDNHDGVDDLGAFAVCNVSVGNILFTQVIDLQGVTPSSLVKVKREITNSNTTFNWDNAVHQLSAYISIMPYTRTVSLVNPTQSGTMVMRYRTWFDANNNNQIDASECAGDWIVYTVTVDPVLSTSINITADVNPVCGTSTPVTFTAITTNAGGTPTFQWKVNNVNAGTNSAIFSYLPTNNDVVKCVLTSSLPCTAPVTSNSVTLYVAPLPQLQITANSVLVTDNHDGIDDQGSFTVSDASSGNILFTQVTDLQGVIPSNLVKVKREITNSNTIFNWSNAVHQLSAYTSIMPYARTVSLVNPTLPGTMVMRYRTWFDANNNNLIDAIECAGDWIVYTVSVNPVLSASINISADLNPVCGTSTSVTFTAITTNAGATPTFQWKVNNVNAGTNSASFSYLPLNNDVVKCVMTSSLPYTVPVTSNSVTLYVAPLPQLQMTANTITVTDNHDGVDDQGAFAVCNATSSNIVFTQVIDLQGVTPSNLVKVKREITNSNTTFNWGNAVHQLSAYTSIMPYTRTVSLVNPTLPGTMVMRYKTWFDANNNNQIDASECAGDWVVYTVTVDPVLSTSINITADVNPVCGNSTTVTFTAITTNAGGTPTYQWKVNNVDAGTNSASFAYIPSNNDVVKCVMTSSLSCTTPVTSNSVTMYVAPLPQLQMTANTVTVTDNHDGVDDQGAFAVCNATSSNILFTQVIDLQGVTPSNLVKVKREITNSNTTFNWGNAVHQLSAYTSIMPYTRTVSLVNPTQPGTMIMRYRTWFDANNNNQIDAVECAGDWIVYTVTVNTCTFQSSDTIDLVTITEAPKLFAYAVNNDEIRVVGNVTGGSEATLYDMYGKAVLFRKLEGSDLNIIPTPGVGTGIYILRINDHGKVDTFKLLLKE